MWVNRYSGTLAPWSFCAKITSNKQKKPQKENICLLINITVPV